MCQTATWEPWRRLLVSSVLMCDSIFFKSLNSPFFKLLLFFFLQDFQSKLHSECMKLFYCNLLTVTFWS